MNIDCSAIIMLDVRKIKTDHVADLNKLLSRSDWVVRHFQINFDC